jgi:hypothetical protein
MYRHVRDVRARSPVSFEARDLLAARDATSVENDRIEGPSIRFSSIVFSVWYRDLENQFERVAKARSAQTFSLTHDDYQNDPPPRRSVIGSIEPRHCGGASVAAPGAARRASRRLRCSR